MPKKHMIKFNIILDNTLENKKATILILRMMMIMMMKMRTVISTL